MKEKEKNDNETVIKIFILINNEPIPQLTATAKRNLLYPATFSIDNSLETRPESGTSVLQMGTLHVGHCFHNSGPQRIEVVMRIFVSDSFQRAPHVIIHRIKVRGVMRPEVLRPEHVDVFIEPVLDEVTGVYWSAVFGSLRERSSEQSPHRLPN